jgi:hypothetical protein
MIRLHIYNIDFFVMKIVMLTATLRTLDFFLNPILFAIYIYIYIYIYIQQIGVRIGCCGLGKGTHIVPFHSY